jgi:predicted nucleic acid-binding protein
VIVLDASVWVSALRTTDTNHLTSRQWIAEWTRDGNLIHVPRLFLAEVGGAVARTSSMPTIGLKAIADIVANPAVRLRSVDDAFVGLASQTAADVLLRGSDAIYVALALRTPRHVGQRADREACQSHRRPHADDLKNDSVYMH